LESLDTAGVRIRFAGNLGGSGDVDGDENDSNNEDSNHATKGSCWLRVLDAETPLELRFYLYHCGTLGGVNVLTKIVLVLGFACATWFGQPGPAQKALLKVESQWYDSYLKCDSATMNRIDGEHFVVITQTLPTDRFKPMQKSRNFAGRSEADNSRMARTKRSLAQLQVRFIGDVAIINTIETLSAPDATGVEKSRQTYYIIVWTKRTGTWQVINSQFTPVPESPR
jgi:ketosteroid isomerase-like protein